MKEEIENNMEGVLKMDRIPKDFDSNKLLQFRMVAREQNMRSASQKLYISAPALSKTIKNLEAELNCQLFLRSGRNIVLTESGRKLLEYTEELAALFDKIYQTFFTSRDTEKRLVIFSGDYLSGLYEQQEQTGIDRFLVQCFEGNKQEDILNMLDDGTADLAVCYDIPGKTGYQKIPLDEEEYYLIVSNDDVLFQDIVQIPIQDLHGLPVICIQTMESWLREFERYSHVKFRLRAKIHYLSMSKGISSIKEYVLTGRPSKYITMGQYAAPNKRMIPILGIPPRQIYVWYKPENEKYALELKHMFQ